MPSLTSTILEITFRLSLHDVYRANSAISSDNLKRLRPLLTIIAVVLAASIAFGYASSGPSGLVPSLLRGGIWGILFFPTFLLLICYVSTYFAAKSLFKSNVNLQNPIHYSFSDDIVIQEMATGRAELRWNTFIRVKETRDLFLLFVQKQLAHPIPKRAFES
jgi:hypothetical protein